MGELNEMVGTAIPRALKKRLLEQAKRERRSMSQIIRLAIEHYLDAKQCKDGNCV